jgi:hypothetical protein
MQSSAAHGDYFSITDTYDPLANRRAFYDASFVLPPAMLESYVASWPAPRIENFRYMLRSGMLGWFSLMQGTSQWSKEQRTEARVQFALYKSALRPQIREADLYHVAERPDGVHWTVSNTTRPCCDAACCTRSVERRPSSPRTDSACSASTHGLATGSSSRIRARPPTACCLVNY